MRQWSTVDRKLILFVFIFGVAIQKRWIPWRNPTRTIQQILTQNERSRTVWMESNEWVKILWMSLWSILVSKHTHANSNDGRIPISRLLTENSMEKSEQNNFWVFQHFNSIAFRVIPRTFEHLNKGKRNFYRAIARCKNKPNTSHH